MAFPFVYQTVFGGSNIYSSDVSYRAITLTGNLQLLWPLESTAGADNYAARIIDVTQPSISSVPIIFLPDARGSGVGETILFSNVKMTYPFKVYAYGSTTQVALIESGQSVQVYLADNTTAAGVWRAVQFGVSSTTSLASDLDGAGLRANGTVLDTAIPQFPVDVNTTLGPSNRAALVNWKAAGGTITLPDPVTLGNDWYCLVRNTGSTIAYGQLILQPASGVLIDGAANKILRPAESCTLITDGVSYFTVGYGQNASFVFDFLVIPLTVSTGTFTLTGNNLNRIAYSFTGLLTGEITILVPPSKQQYWINNATTGAFNFYIGVTTSNRIQIIQGQRLIVYCDGANMVRANDNNVPNPIPVNQGGTGSTTADGALMNLGGNPLIGIPVFTTRNLAVAQAALGIVDQTGTTIALVLALGG